MEFWANKMPAGMLLRSPREASNIADPRSAFTAWKHYEEGVSDPTGHATPAGDFCQVRTLVSTTLGLELDYTSVRHVSREKSHFLLSLARRHDFRSRRVVVAAGVGPFNRKPAVFADLPCDQASHCYEGRKIADLAGRRIAVIGAGQSALESAAFCMRRARKLRSSPGLQVFDGLACIGGCIT